MIGVRRSLLPSRTSKPRDAVTRDNVAPARPWRRSQQEAKNTSVLGVVSVSVGVVLIGSGGLLCLPYFGPLAILLATLGLILGVLGLLVAKTGRNSSLVLPLAGILVKMVTIRIAGFCFWWYQKRSTADSLTDTIDHMRWLLPYAAWATTTIILLWPVNPRRPVAKWIGNARLVGLLVLYTFPGVVLGFFDFYWWVYVTLEDHKKLAFWWVGGVYLGVSAFGLVVLRERAPKVVVIPVPLSVSPGNPEHPCYLCGAELPVEARERKVCAACRA